MTLIEADPKTVSAILIRSQDGIAAGFAGDGGPPPNAPRRESNHAEDAVPGYTPDFGFTGGHEEEPGFDPGTQVPDYAPEALDGED